MVEIDSRCGLHCTGCRYKETNGCGGCIETSGHPFHGECPVAACCQGKGLSHCGQCDMIPCDTMYSYSYDKEHGDKPQGARVEVCRRWAAESGTHKWENVLLTDAGFYNPRDLNQPLTALIDRFAKMLGKPFCEVKVLFIPTAAQQNEEAKAVAAILKDELFWIGILPENLMVHDIDGTLSEKEAMEYDVLYFTGGWDAYLLERIKQTGFDKIVKKMVYANKVYVGQSAGSIIATPNIRGCFGDPYSLETSGLCLVNAYVDAHCNFKPDLKPLDLPLPHIMLSDHQALAVSWAGYELVEEINARQEKMMDQPIYGQDIYKTPEESTNE